MSGILIVDDTPLIRSALARILTQHDFSLGPIVEATNGEEAVAQARAHQPDIILMDIKMPVLTGLQAMAIIRKEQPHVKVVMLTAYNEFAYVQKALKLGARDYLLKPVRPDKLVELLEEIRVEIEEERRDLRTVALVKDSLQRTMPVIETNLVESLIRGTLTNASAVNELLAYLAVRLTWPAVLVAKIDQFDTFYERHTNEQRQRIYQTLVELVRAQLPEPRRALVGYSNPGRIVAIVSRDQALLATAQWRALGLRICTAVANQTPITVTIGLGERCETFDSIPTSYAEASLARRTRSFQGGNTAVHIAEVRAAEGHLADAFLFYVQRERELVKSVQNNQAQTAQRLLNESVDYLAQRHKTAPDEMKNHCAELISLVAWGVVSAGVPEETVLDLLHRQVVMLNAVYTINHIRGWTLNSLAEMLSCVQSQSYKRDPVQDAVTYIHQNYQRSDLSLQEIADVVNLSPSYLGAQIKDRVGVSYVKYLTAVRLEQAKKLLRTTDQSVTHVAESVGYPNVTNFYRHFKRQEGITPAVFRDN